MRMPWLTQGSAICMLQCSVACYWYFAWLSVSMARGWRLLYPVYGAWLSLAVRARDMALCRLSWQHVPGILMLHMSVCSRTVCHAVMQHAWGVGVLLTETALMTNRS